MGDWTPDLVRLQSFDDGEWLSVERQFAGRLYAYVARRVPDAQAREDVVQESFLGAVRGIAAFDPSFTFEQYLFGICRNRTIDFLRRRRATTLEPVDDDAPPAIEQLAREEETPSAAFRTADLRDRGQVLLAQILRDWVQETWEAGEFRRLMVIEALFSAGWRNRDTWQTFELRDETAVAGIKFRALKRLRELAARHDGGGELLQALAEDTEDRRTTLDMARIWREGRVSCPARHWLARHVAGTLDEAPRSFLDFHLTRMECPWCTANRDDLQASEAGLEPLLDKVHASTARYLHSRAHPRRASE